MKSTEELKKLAEQVLHGNFNVSEDDRKKLEDYLNIPGSYAGKDMVIKKIIKKYISI